MIGPSAHSSEDTANWNRGVGPLQGRVLDGCKPGKFWAEGVPLAPHIPHPTPPTGATEIRVSGCSPEQLRWRPRSEQGGKVGAQYFQPRESRIPLGYLQPRHSSARGWGGGGRG